MDLSFGGVIDRLKDNIARNDGKFDFRIVVKSLQECFNRDEVYCYCSCLQGDTKIKLLDGTTPTVKEMLDRFESGEQLYVYSVDEKGDFKPGIVEKVWITGNKSDFIEVTLDNEEKILTTPEHLYMLRNGDYLPAAELKVGQSLMPMYFNYKNGYELFMPNSSAKGWRSIYKEVADYFKSDEIEKAKSRVNPNDNMKYEVAIHHKDFNKTNNVPENLQIMTAKEHWDYHASLTFDNLPEEAQNHIREASRKHVIELNANPTENMIESRKQWQEKGGLRNYDGDRKQQQAELFRKVKTEWWDNLSEEQLLEFKQLVSKNKKEEWASGKCYTEKFKVAAKKRGEFMHSPEMEKLSAEGVRKYWDNLSEEDREKRISISKDNLKLASDKIRGTKLSEDHKSKISNARKNFSQEKKDEIANKTNLSKIHFILLKVIEQKLDLTDENYENVRKTLNGYPKIQKCFSSVSDAVSYFKLNHKIKAIRKITLEEQPVYDIKVKDFNNFLVEPGVILHNCPDWHYRMGYWASVHDIIVGQKETRPSDITNPKDNLGPVCKHVCLVLQNLSWVYKLASTIHNYINYMESHYKMAYRSIIYPKLYGKEYEEPSTVKPDDEMGTDTALIDIANKYGRDRGKFKKGNTQGIRFAKETDEPILDDEEDTEQTT